MDPKSKCDSRDQTVICFQAKLNNVAQTDDSVDGHALLWTRTGLDCVKPLRSQSCGAEGATITAWIRIISCDDYGVLLDVYDIDTRVFLMCYEADMM